jgi:hypothetical protein
VVRLLPNGSQGRELRRLASTSARLFNEVNYERRQQFFRGERRSIRIAGPRGDRAAGVDPGNLLAPVRSSIPEAPEREDGVAQPGILRGRGAQGRADRVRRDDE